MTARPPQPRERSFAASPQTPGRPNMGWLYRDEPIDDPLAYLKTKYNYDCETHTLQTLDGACVRNTVYLAVRSTDKKTGRSLVLAAVILISNTKKHGFGYKDMDELMGPCECACPQRIIRLLSPIADLPHPGYAADWRARVASHHEQQRQRRQRRQIAQRRQHRQTAGCHALFRRDYRQRVPCRSCPTPNADFRNSRPARNLLPPSKRNARRRSHRRPTRSRRSAPAARLSVRNRNQN